MLSEGSGPGRKACLPPADTKMTIIIHTLKPTAEASNTPKPVPLIPPHPHKHAHTHTHTHKLRDILEKNQSKFFRSLEKD